MKSRRKVPGWVTTGLAYALSIGCLMWALKGMGWNEMVDDVRSLNWWFILLAVVFDLAIYVAHAWRWTVLLESVSDLEIWRTTQAIYIGLFANEILPLRTGEVIRCYLLAHWNGLHLPIVFASAIIERCIDGAWMVVAVAIAAVFLKLPRELMFMVQVLSVALVLLAILFYLILRYKEHSRTMLRNSRWAFKLHHFLEGLHCMGTSRTMSRTVWASFIYLALQIVPIWALMKAYELDLGFLAAATILAVIRVGTMIPNAPGNLGVHQAFCIIGLSLFGVDQLTSRGFAFVMWFALTLPLLLGGALALALTGLKLNEIKHHAHRGLEHDEPIISA